MAGGAVQPAGATGFASSAPLGAACSAWRWSGWLLSAVWPVAGVVLGVGAFVAASRWRSLRWLDGGRRTQQWLAAGVGLFLGLLAGTAAAGLLP